MSFVLLGYPVSNYSNIVHAALIEKAADFTVEPTRAAQDDSFLALNPMGKIPVLLTPDGPIAETVAILEYLDEALPTPPILADTAYGRARARQMINVVQVYVETPARQLFPGTFFGGTNSPATIDAARPTLERASSALARLIAPAPFLQGSRLGIADIFSFYCLDIVDRVTDHVYGWSFVDSVPHLRTWYDMLTERQSTRTVMAEFLTALPVYLADRGAAYRLPLPNARPQRVAPIL